MEFEQSLRRDSTTSFYITHQIFSVFRRQRYSMINWKTRVSSLKIFYQNRTPTLNQQQRRKGYSGVLTLVKKSLLNSRTEKSVRYGIGEPAFDSEGRFVISDHKDFLLYNIYIPSGTSGEIRQDFKYEFLDSFKEHISQLSTRDRNRLIICGDFNICHRAIDIHHPKVAEKTTAFWIPPHPSVNGLTLFWSSGFMMRIEVSMETSKTCIPGGPIEQAHAAKTSVGELIILSLGKT